eukprot:GEMP01048889.1.p1 GENE.GEMP01048889.1~~GEMP01048889.1.p1  ORF type:complete len:206 (+),score=19.19 GEMP01048889.1:601-1218(+)
MYRHGSALPRTNVKRDDYMWGQVLTMEACSNSSNPECFPRLNASYYIQETLDEWFYQPCRGELGCHLPDHQPPNSQEDLTNFLENGIGHQCKEYADDMALPLRTTGRQGAAQTCAFKCARMRASVILVMRGTLLIRKDVDQNSSGQCMRQIVIFLAMNDNWVGRRQKYRRLMAMWWNYFRRKREIALYKYNYLRSARFLFVQFSI